MWSLAGLVLAYTLVGVWRRFIDRQTFDATDDPAGLTWSRFERLMAEFYRRKGATVTPRGGLIADGGVDLYLSYPSGERLIVQCKHWTERHVGVKPLRELWGVLDDEKADGAIFVTSASFTADALAFARGKRLELIDGLKLRGMMAEVKRTQAVTLIAEVTPGATTPLCPRCESPMVLRVARRGANAGEQFWGCSSTASGSLECGVFRHRVDVDGALLDIPLFLLDSTQHPVKDLRQSINRSRLDRFQSSSGP